MSQLSIYDFLSFFLPGFVAAELLRYIYSIGLFSLPKLTVHFTDGEKGLIILVVSLVLGLFIHIFPFRVARMGWYQRLILQPVGQISAASSHIMHIEPDMNTFCQEAVGKPFFIAPGKVAPDFFDHAYISLEANDKIGQSKEFQSLYFFMRNFFTLSVVSVLLFSALQIWLHCSKDKTDTGMWLLMALFTVAIPISVITARFFRTKMVERIFLTFHVSKKFPLK